MSTNSPIIPKGSLGRTTTRMWGERAHASASTSTVKLVPHEEHGPDIRSRGESTMQDVQAETRVGRPPRLPERWVTHGDPSAHTIQAVRTDHGGHVLERRGGVPPRGWIREFDPMTFQPYFVPPAQSNEETDMTLHAPNSAVTSRFQTETSNQNWFERERHVTRAELRDLKRIPRFFINTPTFQFDSHADNPGWRLSCKQRHHNGRAGKLVIKLVHDDPAVRSTVMIRPSNHNLHRVVRSEADFIELFEDDFQLETDVIARQVHRPLSAYSDDELLAELKKRSDGRLDGWRPRARSVDLTNIVNLDDIRQNLPKLDMDRLSKILAA